MEYTLMNESNPSLKYKIILCCLIAPAFDANFGNLRVLIFDKVIGFEPVRITHFGVLGCYTESWMGVAAVFTFVLENFILVLLGYKLSQHTNIHYKLLGTLFLYSIPYALGFTVLNMAFGHYPFFFSENKERLLVKVVPVFGNAYIFMWVKSIVYQVLQLFYCYLCYRVVFYYWDKQMRIYFFTWGAIACALGLYIWYFLLGPVLYR